MPRAKKNDSKAQTPRHRALSSDARENELIALAQDVAEERMRNGTASAQEITYFLKLGSSLANLQKAEIEKRIALDDAKIKAYQSSDEIKALYENALQAMRSYSQNYTEEDDAYDGR
jgi:hypothetical protein